MPALPTVPPGYRRPRWHPGLLALALVAVSCRALPAPPPPARERFAFEHDAMGTRWRIVAYAPERAALEPAARAAFERVDQLERALSDWNPGSELRRLDAHSDGGAPSAAIPVGADLYRVLERALELARLSGGAFDPTVGPYVRLWRRAARQGEPPTPEELERAARAVSWRALELDPQARTVRFLRADMRLDLGGIAKGDAAQEALAVLRAHGFERAYVDGGGDLALGEPPPGASGWRVALDPWGTLEGEARAASERQVLVLARAAVATSGDALRFVELEGRRTSHLLDPRTGLGLAQRSAVTVVAPDGALADALASAVSVLGPRQGLDLLERLARVEGCIVVALDGEPFPCGTSGWARMMAPTRGSSAEDPARPPTPCPPRAEERP